MHIIEAMSEQARANLRGNLHKVAAVMARQEGHQLPSDTITIKEAAYLVGTGFWRRWLEKRAMLDGLISLRRLSLTGTRR
jgi:hypothetical protein